MSNAVIENLKNHRSIRSFLDKKVEDNIIEEIIDAGIRAATGGNLQSYSFVVINDKNKLNQLGVYNTPLVIIALADQFRTSKWFKVDKVVDNCWVNSLQGFYIAIWDALIALQNIVIAAESLGLGAYYYGDITSINVKNVINNPEYTFPAGMICLGYPNNNGKLSDRLPKEAIIHYNTYKQPTEEEIIEWYKEKETLFLMKNSKENLESFKLKNIYNLGQAYAYNKFKKDELDKLGYGIRQNLKESKFDL